MDEHNRKILEANEAEIAKQFDYLVNSSFLTSVLLELDGEKYLVTATTDSVMARPAIQADGPVGNPAMAHDLAEYLIAKMSDSVRKKIVENYQNHQAKMRRLGR